MEIIGSGVAGLDEVLGGAFVSPSIILIGSNVGTGKTTLALQSLFIEQIKIKEKIGLSI